MTANTGISKGTYTNDTIFFDRILEEKINFSVHTFCKSNKPEEIFVTHKAGMFKLNTETFDIELYEFWNDKLITFVYQDKTLDHIYWIGTSSRGIYRWNKNDGTYRRWDKDSGLSNSKIHSIYEDNKNRLWISTNFGLNCLDKETYEIVQFFNQEYSVLTEFNRSSSCQLSDGSLVYGSISGFIHFNPNFEFEAAYNPTNKIERYSFTNSGNNTVNEIIPNVDQVINIPKAHRDLKIYLQSNLLEEQAIYKYMIPGVFDEWTFTSRGLVHLNQLTVGEHSFYLSKKLSANNWTDTQEFKIKINPPFYLDVWFWVLSLITLLVGIVYLINSRSKRILARNRLIKQEVRSKTKQVVAKNEQLEHMNQTNEILFNILNHDLRTPLTSMANIGGTLNQMIVEKDSRATMIGSTIENRSKHLLEMLDNLMDWTQIQKRLGSFVFKKLEVEPLISSAINELFTEIQKKEIQIDFEPGKKKNIVVSDEEALKIILRNVLHNSIKFTDEKGKIEVLYDYKQSTIIIKDYAGGIPKHIIDLLSRDQKINSTSTKYGQVGLGIGLQISKYLISGIGGEMNFEITDKVGTTTKIILNTKADDKNHLL